MNIISLLNFEEGFSEVPYYCSEGYPTIGIGKRIGPKGAPLSQYQFTVSKSVATVWMSEDVQKVVEEIKKYPNIQAAMIQCNEPRQAVLISMGYQMGVDKLAKFVNTLQSIANKKWADAQAGMLASLWAKQTPNRANRHAIQMLTGVWDQEYK